MTRPQKNEVLSPVGSQPLPLRCNLVLPTGMEAPPFPWGLTSDLPAGSNLVLFKNLTFAPFTEVQPQTLPLGSNVHPSCWGLAEAAPPRPRLQEKPVQTAEAAAKRDTSRKSPG